MFNPSISYEQAYQDYTAAIKWMEELGISKLKISRISHYEKLLRTWKTEYLTASPEDIKKIFPDFISSVFEIGDFINIHKSIKNVDPKKLTHFIKKIEKGANGPTNASEESPQSTKARNFLFEAIVTARMHNPYKGIESLFENESDTGIKTQKKKILIECKRVTSKAKLEKNLRDACNQLGNTLSARVGS